MDYTDIQQDSGRYLQEYVQSKHQRTFLSVANKHIPVRPRKLTERDKVSLG